MSELSTIYNELSRAFNSIDSFEKYYTKQLLRKTKSKWQHSLSEKLYKVHNFLKGRFSERELPTTETVRLWINRIELLYKSAQVINKRMKDKIDRCIAYKGIPEGYFSEQRIEDDLKNTGKSLDELYAIYEDIRRREFKRFKVLQPYAEIGQSTLQSSLNKMHEVFRPILLEKDVVNRKSEAEKKIEFNSIESPTKLKRKNQVKTFECFSDKKIVLHKLYDRLVLLKIIECSKSDFMTLFSGEVSSVLINWRSGLNHLHAFVDSLVDKKIIANADRVKWQITAAYFTCWSEEFTPNAVRHSNKLEIKKAKQIQALYH